MHNLCNVCEASLNFIFATDCSETKIKLIASYSIDKVTTITTYFLSVRSSAYSIGKITESQGKETDFRLWPVDCS